jgi:HEAT repeat protein
MFFAALALLASISEEQSVKRIYDHMLIRDHLSAVAEGKQAAEKYPDSQAVKMAYFRALCSQGDEMEALRCWEKIPEPVQRDRATLEALAWGVLNKAKSSSQLEIRLNVLMAAAFTRDVKALPHLMEEMRSSNAMLRTTAIRLSSSFGDAPLQQEIERLLRQEKLWYVRLEVIKAVGQLRMKQLEPLLKEILINPKTTLEERGTIQVALVSMYESIDREELVSLIRSNRVALRHLACDVLAYLERVDLAPELYPLLKDTSPDVRIAALNALTLLRVEGSFEHIRPHLEDPAYDVAITAAWAAMVFDPSLGKEKLHQWLRDPDAERRRMAAGALAVSGPQGVSLSLRVMRESADIYVKATLAMGLIGQREHVRAAQKTLYTILMADQKTEWMWDNSQNSLFRCLAPSRMRHREGIPQLPKVVDQMVRLELLSLLCMTEHPKAEEALRGFLKSRSWGITGAAASILLGDGDEVSVEISQKLLEDPDEKIRLQAAFILAVMDHNEAALPVLQSMYPSLDRGMKLQVLEAMAQLGEESSIPFLVDQLKEPFQVLRVAAASALIRCLYH